MPSESTADLPVTSMSTMESQSSKSGLSTKTIAAITLTISAGLAIGLGVGLGVGLQSTEYVYVTATTKEISTTKSIATTAIPDEGPWLNYRLRESMVPSHYAITVQPDMDADTYTGSIEMTFSTSEATNYVIIHAHASLVIPDESVKLRLENPMEDVPIVRTFRWPDYQFYIVEVGTNLKTDEDYVLSMEFSNSLVDSIVGIYKSTYVDPDTGEVRGIMASDFEPTDARKGYPCFDEPAMKVEYTTTIVHENKYTALSNMPVAGETDLGNGMTETTFDRSVPMSTYLSCFVVGELLSVGATSSRGVPLKIYGAPYQINSGQGELALASTVAMFDKYEELYDMEFSLPKYDQVAVPEFLAGAMENWGLVIYRETNLMWDPKESSTYQKQRVNAVIAHEMVHQWFGNIVTMKWWNNIWLNEGFASYFEYRGLEWANPDWITRGHHLVDDIHSALRADQSIGSHPINVEVNTPAQITTIFDTISYQKGSSVLNMMEYILGTDLFIGGMRNYLKKRKFSVATEQDLWADVQEYVDSQDASYNVKEIMDPWVQQMGYPVVNVQTTGNDAVAVQVKGFTDPNVDLNDLPDSDYGYKWNIQLNYFTQADPNIIQKSWLNIANSGVTFDVTGYGDWLKFNEREQIFHRVNYDDVMWAAIVTQLTTNHTAFSEMDRSHLVDDVFNLAPATRIEYTQALDLTKYLDKEESYFVWDAFASGSSYIRAMLLSTDDYANFQAYYVTRVKPIADKLGWDATQGTHEEKRMRPTVLNLAATYGDVDALNSATTLYQDWKSGTYIHPDLRSLVYRYGIQAGTQEDWYYMLQKYKDSNIAGERDNLLRGLASTEDVQLIDELLELTKDTSVIKEQDFFTCINYISGYTLTGNNMAWSWVRVNWDYLVGRFGLDNRTFGRMVPSIVEDYKTELQKWEVESFFAANPEAGAGESGRASALLQIDLNIAWLADNAEPIGQWLEDAVAGL